MSIKAATRYHMHASFIAWRSSYDTENTMRAGRTALKILVIMLGAILLGGLRSASAQSGIEPWTTPLNLSKSGAASQPVIAVDPGGVLHAFWWDSVLGELHSTVGLTQSEPGAQTILPDVYGGKLDTVDPQTQRHTITLAPPLDVRSLVDKSGVVRLFWLDSHFQLLTLVISGALTTPAVSIAGSVLAFDVSQGRAGGLHLAYVKTSEDQSSPAGVFYRYYDGRNWLPSSLVVGSRYFRAVSSDSASISVTGNKQGMALVAWDDPRLQHGLFSKTGDGGKTWSDPQSISSAVPATQIRVAHTAGQQFMMIWRESKAGTCVLEQSISSDGMQTWGAPVRVLNDLTRCPRQWEFIPDDGGGMWLLGMPTIFPQDSSSSGSGNQGTLTAWNGQSWLATTSVNVSFEDSTISQTVNLGCISLALSRQTLGIIGCDLHGDVWIARNNVTLNQLGSALKPVWSAVDNHAQENKTSQEGDLFGSVEGVPAMVSDANGQLVALWSQTVQASKPYVSLFATTWNGGMWARYARVLNSPTFVQTTAGIGSDNVNRADQPSLALDNANGLHVVWVGGPIGRMYYSRANIRNPLSSQEWTTPTELLPTGVIGSWPEIIADPRSSSLFVIYAVPYNEGRGIYLLQSNDSGATWSKPLLVFDAVAAGWFSVDKPRIALDPATGELHAVWVRAGLADGVLSRAISYSHSGDNGRTWSQPVQLVTGSVDWPRLVIAGQNQMLVTWSEILENAGSQSTTPLAAIVRTSQDGGERWNDPVHVPGFEKVSGPVDATSVRDGIVHFIAVGETATKESSLLYCRWAGQTCGERDSYNLGQPSIAGNTATIVSVPGHKQLSVLARIWIRQWSGSGEFGLVTAMRDVTSTRVVKPVPTFTPMPLMTPQATATPEPTPTSTPVVISSNVAPSGTDSPALGLSPLVLSGVLTTVIVAGALVLLSMARARR